MKLVLSIVNFCKLDYNRGMNDFFRILIICLAAIPIGIFLGCGAVYVFNRIPAGWLTDYGETPSPELSDQSHQRIPGMPWKYVLSAIFAGLIIYFCTIELGYGASAVLIIWLLLMIGLADAKYMIIPDQFVIFLLLLAGPMSLYKANFRDMLYGALLGGGIMVLIAAIGFILTRKMAIGGGDIKLMAAVGAICGLYGTSMVLAGGSVLAGAYATFGLVSGKLKKGDELPLGPFLCIAAAVWLFFAVAIF